MAKNPDSADQSNLSDLVSLKEAADLCGLSPSYLRVLVREGEVWGQKIGRNWVTTEKAVQDYLSRRRKPGRPPKRPE